VIVKRTLPAALLIATTLHLGIAAAQCPPSCPLPGGGAVEQDCHAEFAAAHVRLNYPPFDPTNPTPRRELHCFDGDPGCDIDGQVDGVCTFDLDVCLHNADPALAGCTPATVTGVTFAGTSDADIAAAQAAVNALLPASANVCTTGQALHIALTRNAGGRLETVSKRVELAAVTDGSGTDEDSLDLTCVPHGWPSHGYDYGNHRANPLETELTADNASTLSVKWHFDIRTLGMPGLNAVTSTPTVGFGFVYVTSWNGTVYALREETGEVEWSFTATPTWPLGTQSSATLTADGRLLMGDADATVHCLDARTGRLLWERALSIPFEGEPGADQNWGSPTVANNRVFIGIASHSDNPCTRGRLVALDLDSGEVLWDLPTVPVRICDNDTSQTCTSDDECNGGACIRGRGAGVTATPAVDATGETVYMNTVGCYTYPSIGDSDSMFRIDAATGDVVWKRRVQPPEQFSACDDTGAECRTEADCDGAACMTKGAYHDFGFLNGPMIIETDDGTGGTHELIVSGSKDGTLYAFHPDDGSLAWTNVVAPTPVTPGFAGFGLFNGAIGYANQRIHAALFVMASPTGNPPNHLRAFSSADGHELWNDEIGRSWSHVGLANDLLFVGTEQTMQRCNSDLQTECTADEECPGSFCVEASPYYVYDARDGRRLTTLTQPANVAGGPSIVDGTAYVPYGTFDVDGGVIAYALPACLGDCNRDGRVGINELVTGVTIALDAAPINRCFALDRNADRSVAIDELIGGTRSALEGCD
jgi:outer membrane protein assembly factor BamB